MNDPLFVGEDFENAQEEKKSESNISGGSTHSRGRIENLTPWKPGQSGNPAGRKKGHYSITRLIKEALAAEDGKRAKELAETILKGATNGEDNKIKMIWERTDKLPTQRTKTTVESSPLVDAIAKMAGWDNKEEKE